MKKCKITVVKKVWHKELSDLYENPIENACDMKVGDVFFSDNGLIPRDFCPSAWQNLRPYVEFLASGKEDVIKGWMKNKKSAMVSCDDGFRPVSFYIEAIDEDVK